MIEKIVRKSVRDFKAINWGNSEKEMRLLWGENPIQAVNSKTIKRLIKGIEFNYYPDPSKTELRKSLGIYNKINFSNILVTNGIDESIELIAKTFIDKGDEAIVVIPSYPSNESAVQLMGGKIKRVKLNSDFELNVDELIKKINKKTKLIFIVNPNNPTGNIIINENQVKKILKNFKGILVIDECYYELSNKTMIGLTKKFENILILRSFSKTFALAGLRVGYCVGSRKTIKYMKNILETLQPFNVNELSQKIALFWLKKNKIKPLIKKFKKEKNIFELKLKKLPKIKIIPTKTTFLLIDLSKTKINSSKLKKELSKQGIAIKDCSIYSGFKNNYCLLGVPKRKRMDFVIKSIENILKGEEK